MKNSHVLPFALLALIVAIPALAVAGPTTASLPDAPIVEVNGGTVTFDVATNVPAVSIHGESKALQGRVRLRDRGQSVVLEELEASVKVESLKTGIGQRDEHMRKYVFTTPAGDVPDLRFAAKDSTCAASASGRERTCRVSGDLTIRGTTRPFAIVLKVSEREGAFRASGDGVVKLSTFEIERPSQLVVKTADEVKLRLEFTARPMAGKALTSLRENR
ncbi:MAG TPA: YceI family protein [Vicinamibacteria bacterium]|nr:YceI family protein [Vicinamibacteria bacterium]